MHLVRLVVSGQHVHDEVHAKPHRHFALSLAAWAVDGQGRPAFAVVPGGERQREMAMRFGVNLVMYVLTGNYKSDQVHVPAILERLGQ